MNELHHACLQTCHDCAAACSQGVSQWLRLEARDAFKDCIAATLDCAAICRLLAELIARDSRFARELYPICARVCEATAAECEKQVADSCSVCAQLCRTCADECRRSAEQLYSAPH